MGGEKDIPVILQSPRASLQHRQEAEEEKEKEDQKGKEETEKKEQEGGGRVKNSHFCLAMNAE